MINDESDSSNRIDRRTALRGMGLAGLGIISGSAFPGSVAAKGNGGPPAGRGPCHKNFECADEDYYVKFEFIEYYDDDSEEYVCYFEEETDTGLIDITGWESKNGEGCEPVYVAWEAEGYVATKVMAFGGNDCDSVEEPDGSYHADPAQSEGDGLVNNGGQTAAISNLQFCLEEAEEVLPECPLYGTSRSDPTAVFSIRYDPESDEVIEEQVGNIPDESANSNYPNGLAFDPNEAVWYFAEEGGILKTMNEDGNLGIEVYGSIAGGDSIAGAAFWDEADEYLFIKQGGDTLMAADISSGQAEIREVTQLDWANIGLGDLAIDREAGMLYVSTTRSNIGPIFFSVDLNDTTDQQLIASAGADSTEFATGKQIAFSEGMLWAHEAEGGDWWTVDVSDGSLSDLVDTTREYTDLAQCGFFELEE